MHFPQFTTLELDVEVPPQSPVDESGTYHYWYYLLPIDAPLPTAGLIPCPPYLGEAETVVAKLNGRAISVDLVVINRLHLDVLGESEAVTEALILQISLGRTTAHFVILGTNQSAPGHELVRQPQQA